MNTRLWLNVKVRKKWCLWQILSSKQVTCFCIIEKRLCLAKAVVLFHRRLNNSSRPWVSAKGHHNLRKRSEEAAQRTAVMMIKSLGRNV